MCPYTHLKLRTPYRGSTGDRYDRAAFELLGYWRACSVLILTVHTPQGSPGRAVALRYVYLCILEDPNIRNLLLACCIVMRRRRAVLAALAGDSADLGV